jgi:hypothetical protein
MPQYLLSVHHAEGDAEPAPEVVEQMFADVGAFNEEVQAAGQWVFAGGLMPRETATVVDATGPEVVTTDGPFIQAKEWLGGFWVVEVPDLDAALDLARRGSAACRGTVEVRPFQGE